MVRGKAEVHVSIDQRGKNVRLYLAADGVRHAEVVGWTGQGLACSRHRLEAIKSWKQELGRPGVYVLLGTDLEQAPVAYIGETDNIIVRMREHVIKKEFWNEMIAFTSKDELLTKAHVEYLEHRLVRIAKEAKRYRLDNGNEPSAAALPRGDRDAMEDFVDAVKVLMGVLGHRLLEPLEQVAPTTQTPAAVVEQFTMSVGDIVAHGFRSDEGFVVREGSRAVLETKPSLSGGGAKLREAMKSDGTFVADTVGGLRFTKDVVFSSPSSAASVVAGTNRNGRKDWHLASGTTLADVEANEAGALTS